MNSLNGTGGAVGRSKVEPASIHPLALPGNQIQYIFEVPSLKKKKKSHQPLMGLIHPQENSFLKIHYFPSARVLSLKGQVKWKHNKIYLFIFVVL